MTINIAVLTSEGIVFGCDSIASSTGYFVDPFACQSEETTDGSMRIKVVPTDIVSQVTNAWDGVTKMFPLQAGSCPVAGVTAGLAKMSSRSMSSFATQFFAARGGEFSLGKVTLNIDGTLADDDEVLDTVEATAGAFLKFMREQYESHYSGSELPEEYRDGPLFLVGGYGRNDQLPSLFRVNVQKNTSKVQFEAGKFGVAWEGQSDAVERLVRGYDSALKQRIEIKIAAEIEALRKTMGAAAAAMLQQVLDKVKVPLPEGVNTELPTPAAFPLPWKDVSLDIAYGNLPLQDAIDLTSFLVGLQSGRAKFAEGVATVGGRTHVGYITKHGGFKMLAEPELQHKHLGFV